MLKPNKYLYLFVVQGNYGGYGWEDLAESDTPELVTLVGRGYFFENDWSSEHTVSWIGPESEVRDAKA